MAKNVQESKFEPHVCTFFVVDDQQLLLSFLDGDGVAELVIDCLQNEFWC